MDGFGRRLAPSDAGSIPATSTNTEPQPRPGWVFCVRVARARFAPGHGGPTAERQRGYRSGTVHR
jgi:hypothetical protein